MLDSIRLIVDPPQDGAWNMAVDEALMRSVGNESDAGPQASVLRFYQWDVPTLSLGYFQHHSQREEHKPSHSLPLVRRNSGGGAIVHDRELTYSLTISDQSLSSDPAIGKPNDLYSLMHSTLIEALGEFGISADMVVTLRPELEKNFLCFSRRAPNDVLISQQKVCGSAQRRKFHAISQHGSVILDTSPFAPEITGINRLASKNVQIEGLIETWKVGIERGLQKPLIESSLTEMETNLAQDIQEGKFSTIKWNCKR